MAPFSIKLQQVLKLMKVSPTYIEDNSIFLGFVEDIDTPDKPINYEEIDFGFCIDENKKGVIKEQVFEIIVDRDNSNDSIEPPSPFFPSAPFAMYILGCVKAGKTTLLHNILRLYFGMFDKIVFISPTADLDPEAINIINKFEIESVFPSLKALDKLYTDIKKCNKGKLPNDKVKVLIIMDDCISEVCKYAKKEWSALNVINLNRRHLNISYIMLSQVFRRIPPAFRINFDCFAIFRLENELEKDKVCQELSGFLGKHRFLEIFNKATSKERGFLSINFDCKDKKYQYTGNFKDILVDDNSLSEAIKRMPNMNKRELVVFAKTFNINGLGMTKKKLLKEIIQSIDKLEDDNENVRLNKNIETNGILEN